MVKTTVKSGVDWISCTLSQHCLECLKTALIDYKLGSFDDVDRISSLHGYKVAYRLNGGRLQWGFLDLNAFVHFELSGVGCQMLGGKIWKVLEYLKFLKAKFTRLDLAFDFENYENLLYYVGRDLNRGFFSGFNTWKEVSSVTSNKKATTYYLGSRSSTKFARVYDKGLESGFTLEPQKVVRFEFVFRGEQSRVVSRFLLNDVSAVVDLAGLTFNLYRFGSYKRFSKSRRWVNSSWYQSLLKSFETLTIRNLPSLVTNPDFEAYCRWLSHQVLPQLKLIAIHNDLTPGQVLDTIAYYTSFSRRIPRVKNKYSLAFKKMYREKEEVTLF